MNGPSDISQIKDPPTSRLEGSVPPVPLGADGGLQHGHHHQYDKEEYPEGEGDDGEGLLPVYPGPAGVTGGQEVVREGGHEGEEEL